jgi:hypothetical protein
MVFEASFIRKMGKKNRTQYYVALQSYEKENNIRPTLELMLKEYRALKKILK